MKKILSFTIVSLYSLLAYSQSVYMHEAQEEVSHSESDFKTMMHGLVFILLIYFVYRIISSIYHDIKVAKRVKEEKKQEEIKKYRENQKKNFIERNRPAISRAQSTAPKRNLSEDEENRLYELNCHESAQLDGHQAVDLGLSVLWSTINVGAESIIDGITTISWAGKKFHKSFMPLDKDEFYKLKRNDYVNLFKNEDASYSGNVEYDPATALWGKEWRTPSVKELEELAIKCKWIYLDDGKIQGYKVIGPSGNFIYIPMLFNSLYQLGTIGASTCLWSSECSEDSKTVTKYNLTFSYSKALIIEQTPREESPKLGIGDCIRGSGAFIRPVSEI